MMPLAIDVLGVGVWSARHRDWADWCAGVDGDAHDDAGVARHARPTAAMLPPAERRRAPDGVAVALEVGAAAVAMARAACTARSPDTALPSVFASAHGDLAIVDYLCRTLASDPLSLSPTRFHHSVHNAAAGYWGIARRDGAASTSLAAGEATFASGLVEAAVQALSTGRPVLSVAFDTPAVGPLAAAVPNHALFGCALVCAPARIDQGDDDPDDAPVASLRLALVDGGGVATAPRSPSLAGLARSSPSAQAAALLERLATGDDGGALVFPAGPGRSLSVVVDRVRRRLGDAIG